MLQLPFSDLQPGKSDFEVEVLRLAVVSGHSENENSDSKQSGALLLVTYTTL